MSRKVHLLGFIAFLRSLFLTLHADIFGELVVSLLWRIGLNGPFHNCRHLVRFLNQHGKLALSRVFQTHYTPHNPFRLHLPTMTLSWAWLEQNSTPGLQDKTQVQGSLIASTFPNLGAVLLEAPGFYPVLGPSVWPGPPSFLSDVPTQWRGRTWSLQSEVLGLSPGSAPCYLCELQKALSLLGPRLGGG